MCKTCDLWNAIRMFKYKVHSCLGEEIGEATHRFLIDPGEVLTVKGRRFRVVDVELLEEQGLDIVALMHVEAA